MPEALYDSIPLTDLQKYLLEQIRESRYPPGRRVQVSLASFFIVHEHYRAIAVLLEKKLYASSFALARPLYEALVKGMWVNHCALDSQIEAFARGRELGSLNELTDELLTSALPTVISTSIRNVKEKYWKVMSSFAHAGHAQVKRWVNSTGVKPTYEDAEIKELSNFTAFMAVAASLEIARLSGNESALKTIHELLPPETNEKT